MKIGKIIKEIRSGKKINQGEFAKMCKVTQTYLSQIEGDIKVPSHTLLSVISKELGVPVSVLSYLAIEKDDVPKKRIKTFEQLSSTIDSLVRSVFLDKPKN